MACRREAQRTPAASDDGEADRLAAQLDEVVKGRPMTDDEFDALDRHLVPRVHVPAGAVDDCGEC